MKFPRYTGLFLLLLVLVIILVLLGNRVNQVFPFLNAILMIGIPLVLGLYLVRRFKKLDLGLFGVGAISFVAAQIFHIPFNQWLLNPLMEWLNLYPAPGSLDLAIAGLFLGLSAGVFEETARYIVYRRWLKENRSWEEGLMFGAGHGGIEAIIFGLLAMWGFLQLVTFRDLSPETLLAVLGQEKGELIQAYLVTYWDAPWYYNLLGAVERMSAICIHLSATLLVLQAFIRKNIGWYILAVLWHTAVDAFAVYGITTWNVYIVEGIIALFGIGSLGIVFALRKKVQTPKKDFQETIVEPIPPLSLSDEPDEITQEKLDDSQYE
jgi:uncharacterized membrane protein YhfC